MLAQWHSAALLACVKRREVRPGWQMAECDRMSLENQSVQRPGLHNNATVAPLSIVRAELTLRYQPGVPSLSFVPLLRM